MTATWRTKAACAGLDVDLFFSEEPGGGGSYPPEVRDTCTSCPVQTECLLAHLYDPDFTHAGFVGGLAPTERRELRVWLSGRTPQRRAPATGNVHCAYHHCRRSFAPRHPHQLHCSSGCKEAASRQHQAVA